VKANSDLDIICQLQLYITVANIFWDFDLMFNEQVFILWLKFSTV